MDINTIFQKGRGLALTKDNSPKLSQGYVEEGDIQAFTSTPVTRHIYDYNTFGLRISYSEDYLNSDGTLVSSVVNIFARQLFFGPKEQVYSAMKKTGKGDSFFFEEGNWEKKLEKLAKRLE